MDPINILFIAGNKEDYLLVKNRLTNGGLNFDSARIASMPLLESSLKKEKYDIVLGDSSKLGFDMLKALETTRSIDKDIPFVIVSDITEEDTAVDIMQAGANDYVIKNNMCRLVPIIRREIKEAANHRKHRKAERDLQTFIYKSSHDLRGPLASIQGILNIMKTADSMEMITNTIYYLEQSTNSLDRALNHLLQIFKIKDGELKLAKIEVNDFFFNICHHFRELEGYENIVFKFHANNLKTIVADRFLIKTVITNVLENSIKYRESSSPGTIEILIFRKNDLININIKDNGDGIDKANHDKVFDMFYRGNLKSNGHGLGLYMAKNAVEKLCGKILLDRKQEEGTLIKVSFPSYELT